MVQPRTNIHGIQDSSIKDWFQDLPLVCRTLLTCYLVTGGLLLFGVLPVTRLYHAWSLELSLPIPELWRLLTNFLIIGRPSLNYLFNLVWLVQYGVSYEKSKFLGNAADAITMAGWGMIFILALDALVPMFFRSAFHGEALIFMLLYLWSKQNPATQVSFFGVVKLQSMYLPFAMLAIDIAQGASPFTGIRGILAGHLYLFFTEVYPRMYGYTPIRTPLWLSRLVYRYGLGKVPVQQVNPVHPSNAGFRAFSGRGQRLS